MTLVKPVGPTKAPRLAGGWIQRWLVLDPISSSGLTQKVVQEEVKKEYFPGQFTTIPKDGDKVTAAHQPLPAAPGAARGTPPQYGDVELTWHAEDTLDYNLNLYHLFFPLKKPTTNVIFYVVTLIDCPQDIPNVRLAIGSNAASVWWLNGEELIGLYNDRQTVQDDGVSKRITLRKGQNILRAAIVNAGGATDFCARFLDEHDKPLHGYTITLNPEK
ncbi:MAG TPA: hypothetical protein VMU19_13410 [Bryobacteraceae bacterium]|nr:hypothetical protein [Bryobacteraceae bacterium]